MIHKALMEYAKNLPVANPHQEKESLQHETFQLKRNYSIDVEKNNELASENIKLKTKLMTLEKENIRLQRVLDE